MATDVKLQAVIEADDKASAKIQGLGASFGKLTAAISIGTLASDAFKRATSFVIDSVKGSINAFAEAEAQTAQTENILRQMNTSLGSNRQLFDAAAKSALKKGFDDEQAQLSLAKLYRTTNDMKFAQESLNTAMDLARDQGIELGESAKMLTLAYAGNQRALKQYGIELPDTASKMDILNAVTQKVRGSSEAFAGTLAGKRQSLSVAFENLQETIGGAIVSGISPYITSLTDSLTRTNDNIGASQSLGKVIYQVAGAAQALGGSFVMTGKVIAIVIGSAVSLFDKIKTLFGGSKDAANLSAEALRNLMDDAANTANGVTEGFKKMVGQGWEPTKAAVSDLAATHEDYTSGVLRSMGATEEATKEIDKHGEAVKEAKGKIADFRIQAVRDFREVRDSIRNDLAQALKDFNEERATIAETGADEIAKILVRKENEASDIKGELDKATTDEQKASLQKRLDDVRDFLKKHEADAIQFSSSMAVIRSTDALDEINQIKRQTALKLQALDDEHAEKVKKINNQMDEMKKAYKKKFDEMHKELKKSKLFELFDDLQNIGQKILKKKNPTPFEAGLAQFLGTIVGRQHGGLVSGGRPHIVGEAGPELFVPSSGGRVIPNNQMGGEINVNFFNPSVRNDQDLQDIIGAVKAALSRDLRLARTGAR